MAEDDRGDAHAQGTQTQTPESGGATTAPSSNSSYGGDPKYAQAIRFLVSLQSQKNQDVEAQRTFLLSKGLNDETITRALEEAQRPHETAILANDAAQHARSATADLGDAEAFDVAARMFDDPLHADDTVSPALPPKTYPRSPLALYQQQSDLNPYVHSTIDNPLTRYHVLLRFFRSLSYFLMLGGGVAAVLVGLYRSYMMPRIIATLDGRSTLLKHHRDLYIMLANRVNDVRHNGLATLATGKTQSISRRSSMKKVQFADEVGVASGASLHEGKEGSSDEEEKKEAGEGKHAKAKSQAEEERPLLPEQRDEEVKDSVEPDSSAVEPIDIFEPLRSSLVRLRDSLKADMSASAIGTEVITLSQSSALSATPKTVSVEDESDADSWLSESDSDELEFDPYAAPSSKSRHSASGAGRRKHAPKSGALSSAQKTSDDTSATDKSSAALKSSLGVMNAYMNSQTFRARAGGSYSGVSGSAFGTLGGIGASTSGDGKEDPVNGAPANRQGDVAQIRAEIRSLKGLLLSRRNFPIYGRASHNQPRAETAA